MSVTNCAAAVSVLTEWIVARAREAKAKTLVFGLSGGVDSELHESGLLLRKAR